MKVLFIAHNCVLEYNQKRLKSIAKLNNIDLTLLVPPWNIESSGKVYIEKKEDPDFKIIVGRSVFSYILNQRYLQFYPALPFILIKENPKIIDLWEEPWSLISFLTILIKKMFLKNTKIIVETEQNIYKNFPFPFSYFEKFTLKNADLIIARSIEAKAVIQKKGFKKQVEVIPNGICLDDFMPTQSKEYYKKILANSSQFNVSLNDCSLKNSFLIGFIGRLEEEKGVITLLKAFDNLKKYKQLKLLFIGDGSLKKILEEMVDKLYLKDKVFFLGPIQSKEIIKLLHCLDLLILPSKSTPKWKEQFGRVLIEAMAAGIPVIGSNSGEIPNVIADSGLIFKEEDYLDLSDKIESLIIDKNLYESLKEKGLKRVKSNFSWDQIAKKNIELYKKLLRFRS